MKGILKTVIWMLAALLLWGCDKPQQEEPDVPQEPVADFVLAVGCYSSFMSFCCYAEG